MEWEDSGTKIVHNLIAGNPGSGVFLARHPFNAGALSNKVQISQNSIFLNTRLGIDLGEQSASNPAIDYRTGVAPYVTPNDGIVGTSVANNGIDYPIFTGLGYNSASKVLSLKGYVGSAAGQGGTFGGATLEIFISDKAKTGVAGSTETIDTTDLGKVIISDNLSKSHGEGRTYIGSIVSDAQGNFNASLTVPAYVTLKASDYLTATATDTNGNTSEFSQAVIAAAPPNLLLVKRITAVNGASFTAFVDDGVKDALGNTIDLNPLWPSPSSTYLRGQVTLSTKLLPGDEVEYTIYFLNAGGSLAQNVSLCDQVPTNTNFVANAYNGLSPQDSGSIFGVDEGIALAWNSASLPTAPNRYFANASSIFGGTQFFLPGLDAPAAANPPTFASPLPGAQNLSGVVCITKVNGSNLSIPNALSAGVPSDSYGFFRFKTKIR